MKTIAPCRHWFFLLSLSVVVLGCEEQRPASRPSAPPRETAQRADSHQERASSPAAQKGSGEFPPAPEALTPEKEPPATDPPPPAANVKRVLLARNLWFENDGKKRRVIVGAVVCLREGQYGLECLMCKRHTKEHESILATDADAEKIHAALMAAEARPGKPVQFDPEFKPPSGSTIKVTLQYEKDGKVVTARAQEWIWDAKTQKDMEYYWVFAGSLHWPIPDEPNKPPIYAANSEGAVISISNVQTSMLDLPINSPRGLEDRAFAPHTKRIPAVGTRVFVILEPEVDKKK